MKKLLAMLLALTMLLPLLATAEGTTDVGAIGGVDGPTEIYVVSDAELPILQLPGVLAEAATAAGRRVVNTLKITELSGIPMGTEEETQAINDVINALTVVASEQGDEGSVKVQLSGKDVLTLGAAMSGKDAYINSDLLAGTIVVAEDEVDGLIKRLMTLLVSMEVVTQDEADSFYEEIAALELVMQQNQATTAQITALLEQADTYNYSALDKALEIVAGKLEMVEAPVVPKACDAAVMGVQASINNEEMQQIMLSLCQFVQDNAALKEALGIMLGCYTEEEIAKTWEENKEFYLEYGIYESEEEFRSYMMTIDSFMTELVALVGTQKVLDGEFVVKVYVDEQGMPVYMAMDMPLYSEYTVYDEDTAESQTVGYTTPVSLTYTRQTLANGVDHVCNIGMDGETLSIDVVTAENSMSLTLDTIASDGTIAKLMDLTVQTQPAADENTADAMTAKMNLIYEGEEPMATLLLNGESLFTNDRSYLSGKLTISASGLGELGTLTMSSDTAINGVDFTGKAIVKVESQAAGLNMTIEADYLTTDPVESIMAGQVVRPAELDDSAFNEWVAGIQTNFYTWMTNAMSALPASVMQLLVPAE